MKLLIEILEQHYTPDRQKEIISLLKKHDILSLLENITRQLKSRLSKALELEYSAPTIDIASISSSTLAAVNNRVIQIEDSEEKRKVQKIVAAVGFRILLSIITVFPNDAIEIFQAVKLSLHTASELLDYDYSDIERLMAFEQVDIILNTLGGHQQSMEIKQIEKKQLAYLLWTEKMPLDFLLFELKKRKWIQSKNNFSKLFGNSDSDLIVYWDMKYKPYLAHLMFRLVNEDFVRVVDDKVGRGGHFVISQKHIVDFFGKRLTDNALKKLSSKINCDPDKYTIYIKEIDKIIESISNNKRGLFRD